EPRRAAPARNPGASAATQKIRARPGRRRKLPVADELPARGARTAVAGHGDALCGGGPARSAGKSRGQRQFALLRAGSLRTAMGQGSLALVAGRKPLLLCSLQIYSAGRVICWTRAIRLRTLAGLRKEWNCLDETEH